MEYWSRNLPDTPNSVPPTTERNSEHNNLINSTTKIEEDRDEHNDGMYTMATTYERNVKRSLALALQLQR